MIKKLTIALSIIFITSNAYADKISCTGNDWVEVGLKTATSGLSVRSFNKYKKKCGSRLEENAQSLYLDGYTKGVIEFCTFDKGYEYGSNKLDLPEVCPYEVRENFVKGYNLGVIELREKLHRFKRAQEDQNNNKVRDQMSQGNMMGAGLNQ